MGMADLSTQLKELLVLRAYVCQDGQRLGVLDSVTVTAKCLTYMVKCANWAIKSPAIMLKYW